MEDKKETEIISAEDKKELDYDKMTVEDALEYMSLEKGADIKAIDDRFWQMSKNYRGKDDPESKAMEDEIAAVYDIASGRRDARRREEEIREKKVKFFGKTFDEWKTVVHYGWFKAIVITAASAILISIIVSLIVNNIMATNSVIFFGHIQLNDAFVKEALIEEGYEHPNVAFADVIVPNDEGLIEEAYANESLNALFFSDPDVIFSDKASYRYYSDIFKDIGPIYDKVMAGLSDKAKANIEPVYMSEKEAAEFENELYKRVGIEDEELADTTGLSDEPVMIGLEITDVNVTKKLGVNILWKDQNMDMIIGQSAKSDRDDDAVKIMTAILNKAFE